MCRYHTHFERPDIVPAIYPRKGSWNTSVPSLDIVDFIIFV